MIERYYTMLGEIHRRTTVSDGMGGGITKWIAIMSTMGILDRLSANETYRAGKYMNESTHVWICSPFTLLIPDPDVQTTYFGAMLQPSRYGEAIPAELLPDDKLVVDGQNFDILSIDNPMNFGHHLEIELKRTESGNV